MSFQSGANSNNFLINYLTRDRFVEYFELNSFINNTNTDTDNNNANNSNPNNNTGNRGNSSGGFQAFSGRGTTIG